MATLRFPAFYGLVAALAFVGLAAAADDDAALRDKIVGLNNLTGNDTIEGEIKVLVKDKDGTKKMLVAAVKILKEKDQPLNYNAAYILGRCAEQLKDLDNSETFYRFCTDEATKLQSGQKLADSFGRLIDLYYTSKKFDKAVKLCQEFLELKGNDSVKQLKPAVMERMIQALARDGKTDEALKRVEKMVEAQGGDGWWALQLKGWVLREADKNAEAAETYEEVVKRVTDDKLIEDEKLRQRYIERNRYLLSGVYVDLNKIDKAAEHLKALLKLKPDDPTYNNDLGYIWADHDMNLDEAEKMIRKALEEDRKRRKKDPEAEDDKDNSAYLDSLGWVLYKKKNYKEAKKWLSEALKDKDDGQHIDIYDHLGDVCKALGEKDEAIAAWKKGVEVAGTSKREVKKKAEVEKKIKDNQ
jgi:tetratricopeptide (TPR) repeat protein